MSDTVTLSANSGSAQTAVVTATVSINGASDPSVGVQWASSDTAVAEVQIEKGAPQSAIVAAVADPSGPSTRTATITGTVTVGGVSYSGSGTATVVTTADSVTVTLDFGTPTP